MGSSLSLSGSCARCFQNNAVLAVENEERNSALRVIELAALAFSAFIFGVSDLEELTTTADTICHEGTV